MRSIRYRGIPIFKKHEWVYGLVICDRLKGHYFIITDNLLQIRIIPETLGEFTGRKDKNVKNIYEGDIIVTQFPSNNNEVSYTEVGVVLIRDLFKGAFIFDEMNNLNYKLYNNSEIVGNVYDNYLLNKYILMYDYEDVFIYGLPANNLYISLFL